MSTVVMIDGVRVPTEGAHVSVFDRGFLYGDSVFEVLRTYAGKCFAMDEHLRRLATSAERVLIRLPVSLARIEGEVRAGVAAESHPESYVRIVVTRGSGPIALDPATAHGPLRVVVVAPLPAQPPELYAGGVGLALVPSGRCADATPAAGAKASNYLANMLALRAAKDRDAYEALLLAGDGQVLEGSSSNVFLVKGDVLATPPLASGILAGITRSHVMVVAAELGLDVQERPVFPVDLMSADEVFITSTLREVMPAVRIEEAVVGSGRPGPRTRAIHAAFLTRARASAS